MPHNSLLLIYDGCLTHTEGTLILLMLNNQRKVSHPKPFLDLPFCLMLFCALPLHNDTEARDTAIKKQAQEAKQRGEAAGRQLWVEKYTPASFAELLSADVLPQSVSSRFGFHK
jgi:hypothetical protein